MYFRQRKVISGWFSRLFTLKLTHFREWCRSERYARKNWTQIVITKDTNFYNALQNKEKSYISFFYTFCPQVQRAFALVPDLWTSKHGMLLSNIRGKATNKLDDIKRLISEIDVNASHKYGNVSIFQQFY